jgi:hypothetical protein
MLCVRAGKAIMEILADRCLKYFTIESTEMKKREFLILLLVATFGIIIGRLTAPRAAHAQLGPSWRKEQVLPVAIVKPDIGGFSPIHGSSIGNTWRKDEVTPMCLVKPDIGGFTPTRGSSIGNTWRKDEVKPFILVEPSIGGFVPSESPVF